ncbi:MAG TPA: carbamoyl phosphate synthase large subunit, partial [Actinomycetota bacterium]|nr:carbamoyl phosphate synthase large subunit [Actinomycetota bacterium]
PAKGTVFVSVADRDKPEIVGPVQALVELGFNVVSTAGTAAHLGGAGVPVRVVGKYSDAVGGAGSIVGDILAGDVDLVINTPRGRGPRADGYEIRAAAVRRNIPYVTTMEAVRATVAGIEALRRGCLTVRSLQEYLAHSGEESR